MNVVEILRRMGILPSRRPPSDGDLQAFALACFGEAQRLLLQRRYRAAIRAVGEYRRAIVWERFPRTDNRPASVPRLSVVVVAYRTGQRLLECLESLLACPGPSTEIIVVDNGGNESVGEALGRMPLCLVKCPANLLLSEGRNIGVAQARAELVCFVDDDAVVRAEYTEAVVAGFSDAGVAALRGRVLPRDRAEAADGVGHYDLGPHRVPSPVNTEGNSAFRRQIYVDVGGMDPLLFGHEGLDLSYRIARRCGLAATIYWPDAVIMHDYPAAGEKRDAKDQRHALMWKYLVWKAPGVRRYVKRMRRLLKDSCPGERPAP